MSVKKFKFVSPGVFLSEVDNSQLPAEERVIGPLIIGRTQFGPAMRPIQINSFAEYVQTFGNPVPGQSGGDVWRDGNQQGPTYAAYAAQAYLKAQVGPVTMVRLLGAQNENAAGSDAPSSLGKAGWALEGSIAGTDGGAYGLVLIDSGSSAGSGGVKAGHLAAIWYINSGQIELSGTLAGFGGATGRTGSYGLFKNNGTAGIPEYTVIIKDATGAVKHKTAFDFASTSAKFVRNVFNTNPQLINSAVVNAANLKSGEGLYWLGETFEDYIESKLNNGITNPDAMIVALGNLAGTTSRADMRQSYAEASTGMFIGQDLTNNTAGFKASDQQQLFQIIARDAGTNAQKSLKISIENLKSSTSLSQPYGSFDLVIRRANDSDNVVRYVERFSNLTLNPADPNYIAAKIGDKYVEYDSTQSRLREYGEFDNLSKYIRVSMVDDVASGLTDARYLPFGVIGPDIPATVQMQTGSGAVTVANGKSSIVVTGSAAAGTFAKAGGGNYLAGGYTNHTCSITWPRVTLRVSASAGNLGNPQDAFFGAQAATLLNGSRGSIVPDAGWTDFLRPFPAGLNGTLTPCWTFTMDDIVTGSSATAYWQSGSRAAGTSATAVGSWKTLLSTGYDSFTAPLSDGFDGLRITEIEPFRNSAMTSATQFNNYAFNSIDQALNSISDPEVVEYNILTVPGVTQDTLNQKMIDVCEDRGDALAVLDLPDVYKPFTENTDSFKNRISTPSQTITALTPRQISTSYACTYYPWVQVRDPQVNRLLWVPPSVIALGVMANSEAKSEVWFAPAGFNRGGLTEGSAGIPVTGLTYKLTSKDRDSLYEASINPIASFPSEGIVVFGQKTMQVEPSALDRINVRRLMIFLKKRISVIASGLLFDQNVQVTWDRFLAQVNPFLSSVQSRLGLSEFRVILDDTTTTPDLVDQNIMYAKIFLKPARSIEFIAVDFVITRSGASFDD
jgi:hypothetical protein